ncbi:hypothetical protein [Arthrobacter sp. Soil762]|uniref:hypothetical protein n=1 Tax=Arthrobacter sp. Soil762 TaxID=1736401 RepID=UPI0006FA0A74|nr:hypothetical protein [Arthrobacter sp. Soil762]KRE80946.1 hypothetical protein ASG77_03170 [Arthrobacter sp. Soil762]
MTDAETRVIWTCRELSTGDEIEAKYKDRVIHRGQVTEVIPQLELFWIIDTLTGGPKLLDTAEFAIFRVPLAEIPGKPDTELTQ